MSFSAHVFKSIETLKEMMHDRGASELKNRLNEISPSWIDETLASKNTFFIETSRARIMFVLSSKFRLADVKKFLEDDDFDYVMLITKDKISSINLRAIAEMKRNIQAYELRELQFNITRHMLVPKHELVTDEHAIQNLVKSHNLKSRSQFPVILKSDPIARYLNARTGNVIKITRWSPTSGETVVYRCCV
jgi:DNA-directed RNA polymerase subunit H (RpoH/RPB5)